jgi:ABC-2 type transport system permease protein
MSASMVIRLVLKDWYLSRGLFVAAILAGLATLGAVAAAKGAMLAMILGVIVLVTILIGMGAFLMSSTVNERKQQTLPFVMSLPISYLEYTTSKLVGSLFIFGVLWLALLLGIVVTILITPWFPHGLIPFVVVMAVEVLATTSLIAAVSVTTESQGWVIGITQVGSLALNAVGFSIVRLDGIRDTMSGPDVHFSSTAITILLVEFAVIALMLAIAFYVQSRKRDFV